MFLTPLGAAAEGPVATTAMSIKHAKRKLRKQIRNGWEVAAGSLEIRDCYRDVGRQGIPKVQCDDIYFETVYYHARCGYGWIKEYTTYYRYVVRAPRC